MEDKANIFNTDKALRILVTLRALPLLRSLCCYRCCCCPYCPDRLSPFFTRVLRVTYGKFNLRLHYIMKLNGFVNNNTSRRITPLNEIFSRILMNIKQLNSYKSVTNICEHSIVKSQLHKMCNRFSPTLKVCLQPSKLQRMFILLTFVIKLYVIVITRALKLPAKCLLSC